MLSAPPWMKNSGRGSSELSTSSGLHAQLQHLLDAECDRRAVAAGHAAIGVEDDVETFAPERDGDPQRALALALVPSRDDHRLGRARLAEMPRPEVDAIGCHELYLFVVGLELKRR